jgi:tripartite ATP-independent transporter DctM subunit
MEWYVCLAIIVSVFFVLLVTGMPVAFSFLFVNLLGVLLWWGGISGLAQLIKSIASSVTNFSLIPVPMFILLGEVMFHTGMATRAIDALDQWLGRIPGRLSLLAVGGGTVFAMLSGSSMAGVATLGSVFVPEMEKRGYKKSMSLGPILGSGGLSIMIPPTALGVLLACLAKISVGAILMSIIIPGLTVAVLYLIYIIVRCKIQPELAPSYEVLSVPLKQKLSNSLRYVLPLAIIVFFVTVTIFLGIATPSEAAATGALSAFVLAAIYGKINWGILKITVSSTVQITVMMLMIFTGSMAFSQILAFTGATGGLVQLVTGLPLAPIAILVLMQIILLLLGTFMEPMAIMMIALPVYMPIVNTLGINPIWFGTIMLLNMEMATLSPPFGLSLFAMKAVAPSDTTMGDVYKAAIPFWALQLLVMLLMIVFPPMVLWLPSMMAV